MPAKLGWRSFPQHLFEGARESPRMRGRADEFRSGLNVQGCLTQRIKNAQLPAVDIERCDDPAEGALVGRVVAGP